MLCYQYGGESKSGLEAPGSPANWRSTALEKFSQVKLLEDVWRTAPNHSRPPRVSSTLLPMPKITLPALHKRTVRKFSGQEPSEYRSHGRNRVGVMPFGANTAIRAGGSRATAPGLIVQHGRPGRARKTVPLAVSRILCKHSRGLMFRAGYTGCTRAEGKALRRRKLSADSAAGIRRDRAQLVPAFSQSWR